MMMLIMKSGKNNSRVPPIQPKLLSDFDTVNKSMCLNRKTWSNSIYDSNSQKNQSATEEPHG